MSYARFGWGGSDVYLFLNVQGFLECCGCILQETEWIDDPDRTILKGYLKPVGEIVQTEFLTTAELLRHLEVHQAAGHFVPQDTIDDLLADGEQNDAWIAEVQAEKSTTIQPDVN